MQVQSRPQPPSKPPQQPRPQPQFLDSSRSLRRDGLLATALAAPVLLPRPAGGALGGVVGGLGLLASYGEVREGMRWMNTHEVMDGALHMGASAACLAGAALPNPVLRALLCGGGLSLLSLKVVCDRPGDVADVLVRQPVVLARDAGKSVWNEIHPPKTTKEN